MIFLVVLIGVDPLVVLVAMVLVLVLETDPLEVVVVDPAPDDSL